MDESIFDQLISEPSSVEIDFSKFDIIAFTDGSCLMKIKSGGSGVYFHAENSDLDQIKLLEHVPKSEILYMDLNNKIIYSGDELHFARYCEYDDCINIGYASYNNKLYCSKHKSQDSKMVATYVRHPPTNIRAEGNAIFLAMNVILNAATGKVKTETQSINDIVVTDLKLEKITEVNQTILIITDSKFWIDLIKEWLPGWISKKKIMERKNIDIVVKIIITLNKLAQLGIKIDFLHVYGHQDKEKKELSFQEKGNVIADKLATHASAMSRYGIFLTR